MWKTSAKLAALTALTSTLALVFGLFIFSSSLQVSETALSRDLKLLLPDAEVASGSGWSMLNLPISGISKYDEPTKERLQFDDFVYRRFTSSRGVFSVYIVHWIPGNPVPPREINHHRPDVCWVNTGWSDLGTERVSEVHIAGFPFPDGQFGIYSYDDFRLSAYFWHLVNGDSYFYMNTDLIGRTVQILKTASTLKALRGYEQVVVRIESPDFAAVVGDPFFQRVVADLSQTLANLERGK